MEKFNRKLVVMDRDRTGWALLDILQIDIASRTTFTWYDADGKPETFFKMHRSNNRHDEINSDMKLREVSGMSSETLSNKGYRNKPLYEEMVNNILQNKGLVAANLPLMNKDGYPVVYSDGPEKGLPVMITTDNGERPELTDQVKHVLENFSEFSGDTMSYKDFNPTFKGDTTMSNNEATNTANSSGPDEANPIHEAGKFDGIQLGNPKDADEKKADTESNDKNPAEPNATEVNQADTPEDPALNNPMVNQYDEHMKKIVNEECNSPEEGIQNLATYVANVCGKKSKELDDKIAREEQIRLQMQMQQGGNRPASLLSTLANKLSGGNNQDTLYPLKAEAMMNKRRGTSVLDNASSYERNMSRVQELIGLAKTATPDQLNIIKNEISTHQNNMRNNIENIGSDLKALNSSYKGDISQAFGPHGQEMLDKVSATLDNSSPAFTAGSDNKAGQELIDSMKLNEDNKGMMKNLQDSIKSLIEALAKIFSRK